MSRLRYRTDNTWYKGNIHIHSTASDGGKTFAELAQMYAEVGYDFLFRTDHWVASDAERDPGTYPLVWLDGIELDGYDYHGSYYHVVCLGTFTGPAFKSRETAGFDSRRDFVPALEAARAQGGLLILAHPYWTGNTLEDARRWGFHGVEIYNHVCRWLNGKGDGRPYWSAMLRHKPNTLAFAVDDAHIRPEHPGWNGGWIMVNAPTCGRRDLWDAICAGNFYATCGPEFYTITYRESEVMITTSPVRFARLVGPGSSGARIGAFDGSLLNEVTFEIPADWPYAYLEIEDDQGQRAWTNPLFIEP